MAGIGVSVIKLPALSEQDIGDLVGDRHGTDGQVSRR